MGQNTTQLKSDQNGVEMKKWLKGHMNVMGGFFGNHVIIKACHVILSGFVFLKFLLMECFSCLWSFSVYLNILGRMKKSLILNI